ncbi:MAG: hypothetical protein RLZZ436_2168 [Planctomycetota bacterium]|jgi:hypothetical protein
MDSVATQASAVAWVVAGWGDSRPPADELSKSYSTIPVYPQVF